MDRWSPPLLKICSIRLWPVANRTTSTNEIKIKWRTRRSILAGRNQRARKTLEVRLALAACTPTTTICTTNVRASRSTLLATMRTISIMLLTLAMPPNPIPKINPRSPSSSAPKKVQWMKSTTCSWLRAAVSLHVSISSRWCTIVCCAHQLPVHRRRLGDHRAMKYPCWKRAAIKSTRRRRRPRAKSPGGGLKRNMKDLTRVSVSVYMYSAICSKLFESIQIFHLFMIYQRLMICSQTQTMVYSAIGCTNSLL